MYRLNGKGLLFLFAITVLCTVYNAFKIEDHHIVCKINKKKMLFLGCIIMIVGLYEIYASYMGRAKTDLGYIKNSNGERVEIPLQYLGKVQAYKEEDFCGNREMMEKYTAWWQKRRDFNGFLGIEITDWDLDFDRHYYIITYGRPATVLYCDTTEWNNYGYEDWTGYDALLESDMEEPYQSGVIYVYEMDKIDLATTQF